MGGTENGAVVLDPVANYTYATALAGRGESMNCALKTVKYVL